jgi:hypothetical protein
MKYEDSHYAGLEYFMGGWQKKKIVEYGVKMTKEYDILKDQLRACKKELREIQKKRKNHGKK